MSICFVLCVLTEQRHAGRGHGNRVTDVKGCNGIRHADTTVELQMYSLNDNVPGNIRYMIHRTGRMDFQSESGTTYQSEEKVFDG